MALAAVGVGVGMGVAVRLTARLLRARRAGSGRPAAVGTAAGLTPVMLTLVTLGACCSTAAAATAGISLAAQSTGTTLSAALAANWYLGVFQLVILWVALLAQEEIVAVYGVLFLRPDAPGAEAVAALEAPPVSLRAGVGAALRVVLIGAGLSWALGAVAAATLLDPFTAPAAAWGDWLGLHLALGGFAVYAGLFPRSLADRFAGRPTGAGPAAGRAALGAGSALLLVGTPLADGGLVGIGNYLLGALGAPAAAGAVVPAVGGIAFGITLLQILLVAAFGLAFALRPQALLAPLLWSAARPSAAPAPGGLLAGAGPPVRGPGPELGAAALGDEP
jgi:hypothetical protein